MGKVLKKEVGFYISPSDADIAAFFNNVRSSSNKGAQFWLTAMFLAELDDIPFSVKDMRGEKFRDASSGSAPVGGGMFGGGKISAPPAAQKKPEAASWTKRGASKEFVQGSVIPVFFYNRLAVRELNDMARRKIMLSTYFKALIRKCMENPAPPTTAEEAETIIRNYLVKHGVNRNRTRTDPQAAPNPKS